jgi:hypothetical protein
MFGSYVIDSLGFLRIIDTPISRTTARLAAASLLYRSGSTS